MPCADQLQLRRGSGAECSTSYHTRPAQRRRITRELDSPHRLCTSKALSSGTARQHLAAATTTAGSHSWQAQAGPASEAASEQAEQPAAGPGLPNVWQDSQDLAQGQAQAPEGLPQLLLLNLDLLLVRTQCQSTHLKCTLVIAAADMQQLQYRAKEQLKASRNSRSPQQRLANVQAAEATYRRCLTLAPRGKRCIAVIVSSCQSYDTAVCQNAHTQAAMQRGVHMWGWGVCWCSRGATRRLTGCMRMVPA